MVFIQFSFENDYNNEPSIKILDMTNEKSNIVQRNYLKVSDNTISKCRGGDKEYYVVPYSNGFELTFKVVDEDSLPDNKDAWDLKELMHDYDDLIYMN